MMADSDALEEIDLRAGQVLFNEGDAPDKAYVVRRGRLEVFRIKRHKRVLLGVVQASEIVGEMALIDDKPRTATVRALVDSKLIVLTRGKLLSKIDKADHVTRHLLTKFISIIRTMDEKLSDEISKIK